MRCAVARVLPELDFPADAVPVIYLPGVSKQDLRAVEECPRTLQPIAEFQYRGALWTHRNGKDWTVSSFLQAREGGLAIDVASDQATRDALRRALPRLANEPLERLRREAPLRAVLLDALLNPDEVGRLLQWLDDPQGYQQASEPAAWAAFCAICRRSCGFSPESDGPISAARLLAGQAGHWVTVWQRFVEAPARYPHLPDLLARARPPKQLSLFDDQQVWPQINSDAETRLRRSLNELRAGYALEARSTIEQLEVEHGLRRTWVWARLDQSPLAAALAHLSALAQATAQPLAGGSLADLATSYAEQGWRSDAEMIAALAAVDRREDVEAVTAAAVTIYRPWLEHSATLWQQRYQEQPPALPAPSEVMMPGTCLLFCDALRLDLGQRLIKLLAQGSSVATLTWHLAALPTITPTAKPAATPVADRCTGSGATALTPMIASGGQRVSAEALRRSLADAGYQILSGDETGDPLGHGWTEAGAIDSYGHQHARRLAHHLADELRAIMQRIEGLLDAGWHQIIVTTDHGWLLLPGGLPRADLPEHLTELRKGRCARLKPHAETAYPTLPWHWDANVRIAMAPGICCFEAGKEYEHGGLSPQECVVPLISVRRTGTTVIPSISAVAWRGLRCSITLADIRDGMAVDLRIRPGDPSTSLVSAVRSPGTDGIVSLLVEDDDRLNEAAIVVLLDAERRIIAQQATIIGG
ncbi:MAG: BREX-1 system phosphatase PglZ type B [Oscillochloridaceae bacterium umkhey_bin13]